ncbi:MAG: hypothetical protein E6J90_04505 [Deltaproteobacteria bacterium]|nr:MAG: hypothetical protein E6J90_04505 [Deltaproteobacteria bacterium]
MSRWIVVTILLWCSVSDAERLRGPNGQVRDVPEASVEYAIKDGWTRIPKVKMRKPDGGVVDMDDDLVEAAERRGAWRMTAKEITDDAEAKRAQAEAKRAQAEAKAERTKPGWFEEPEAAGSWRSRSVEWVTDRDKIEGLLSSGYFRLTEAEHASLLENRAAADRADAKSKKDEERGELAWMAMKIALIGLVGLGVAVLVRRRLKAS